MMATQTSLPSPDLTDADKATVFQILNATLNSMMLYSLLSGVYVHSSRFRSLTMCVGIFTGIVAVILGNICEGTVSSR